MALRGPAKKGQAEGGQAERPGGQAGIPREQPGTPDAGGKWQAEEGAARAEGSPSMLPSAHSEAATGRGLGLQPGLAP